MKEPNRGPNWHHNRNSILKAAHELWTRDGYHETTLEDIADALQRTKPFIYYHFESKEHLLAALILVADLEYRIDPQDAYAQYGVGGKTIRAIEAMETVV
jgi:AcrR family transcriptional regulator